MWAQELQLVDSRAQDQQLWCTDLAALWHVGSSQSKDWTHVPALTDGFLTTGPLGKPGNRFYFVNMCYSIWEASSCCFVLLSFIFEFENCLQFTKMQPLRAIHMQVIHVLFPLDIWWWSVLKSKLREVETRNSMYAYWSFM